MLRRSSALWGAAVALVLLAAFRTGMLDRAERRFYDFHLRSRSAPALDPRIVIVGIDDASLDKIGPWPWPRSVHARLLDRLVGEGRAKAVAFDVLFTEPSRQEAEDKAFAEAARRAGNVFVSMYFTREGPLRLGRFGVKMQSFRLPYRALREAAAGVGPVNVFPDTDGIVRAAPLAIECGGAGYASLNACVANYLVNPEGRPSGIRGGGHMVLGRYQVPVDRAGEMLINYPGGYGTFPTISYGSVLSGDVPTSAFRGKVVLVGFTATGVSDVRPTPLSPACPGVEINAAILNTLMTGRFLSRASPAVDGTLVLLLILAPALLLPVLPRGTGYLLPAALGVGMLGLAIAAFSRWGCWLALGTPLLGLGLSTSGFFVLDARQREHEAIRASSSMSALALATRMIAASTSAQSLIPAIREELRAVLQSSHTLIFRPHPEREALVPVGGAEVGEIIPGEGPAGKAAVGTKAVLLTMEEEGLADLAALVGGPVSSAMIAPLRIGERLLGVALVADRRDRHPYTAEDLELMDALAYEAAVALENAELYGMLEGRVELANQELRRAYARLNTDKERMDSLLDNMADAVVMADAAGYLAFVNPAAARLFGISGGEAIGGHLSKVIPLPQVAELAERALTGDEPVASTQVEVSEPVRKIFNAVSARINDEEGNPDGTVTVLSDVTLIHELSEMKTEFVSLVSHELRTPLTSIQGFTQTLRDDTEGHFDQESRQEFLGIIYGECQRLLTMVNELLDSSRLEAGRPLPMNWSQVSLPALAAKVVALQTNVTDQHTFEVDFPGDFPEVTADQDRMEQVLMNILSNAVKYSPSGGKIRLAGEVGEGEVHLTVTDQGLGMTPDQIGLLFQRYQRLDQDATKHIRGTGLGLYLTKGLVEAHGGRIWAESPGPGEGSTFHLVLPIGREEGE